MNYDLESLLALDKAHLIHVLTPVGSAADVIIERGEGICLFDVNGKRYWDARSQLNCVNLGYSHKGIATAVQKQLEELPFLASFYSFTHPRAIECATKIAELAPGDLNHVFFSSGGSEANELALSMVRQYWAKKNPHKRKIISRYEGYHGNTAAAMSATGMDMAGVPGVPTLVPNHVHMEPPYQYRRGRDMDPDEFGQFCADELARKIECEGKDSVAAFIAEPILGVGGYIPPPDNYWRLVRDVCDAYDVLLILDEVMTGFCRTGHMFASDLYDIVPDFLVMGKGITSNYIPCGGVVIRDHIIDEIEGSYLTGVTNSAHPVSMAACLAAIDAYENEHICDNVNTLAAHFMNRLNEEFLPLPYIGEISGKGLMIGLELVKDKITGEAQAPDVCPSIVGTAVEHGLLIRARGSRLCIGPPLNTTVEEADQILDLFMAVLTTTLGE